MPRIILDSLKIAPKIIRYARRFGDEAAKEKFGSIRVGAAKQREGIPGGFESDIRGARGIDKRTVKSQYKRMFGEEPSSNNYFDDLSEVIKGLKEEGKKILYKSKGGTVDMTKDKKYYKGIL
jgi:hypothetical protein